MKMMQKILGLLIFLLSLSGVSLSANAQQRMTFRVRVSIVPTREPGEINYAPQMQLRYEDFRSNRYSGAYYNVAEVFSGLTLGYRASGYGGVFEIDIKLTASMNPQRSWMKPEGRTPAVLRHEQMHFHLTGLALCNLKKTLEEAPLDKASYKQQIEAIDRAQYEALRAEQDRYDSETVHGTNLREQARWEQEIEARLAAQECYFKI
jgi:hypothetical protein